MRRCGKASTAGAAIAGLTVGVVLLAGGVATAAAASTPPASAGMSIEAGPALVPSSVVVRTGGTVVVRNATGAVYQVQIGAGYVVVLLPGEAADGAGADPPPFSPSSPGRYPVSATRPGQAASGIVQAVSPTAGTPSPAPTTGTPAPAPSTHASAPPAHSASPGAAAPSTATPPAGSARGSRRSTATGRRGERGALASLPPGLLPSLFPSAGAVLGASTAPAAPALAGTAGSTRVQAGPLQRLGLVGGGVALPAAVALVLLAGVVGGLVRVLLAEEAAG